MVPQCQTVPLSHTELKIGIPSDLLRRRPDIRQKERELAARNELIGQAVAEWFPQFILFGNIGTSSSEGTQWFTPNSLRWYIGPSIRWPILNFGRIRSIIEERESIKRQAALEYSKTIINALKDVEDFLIAYLENNEQLSLLEQQLEYAKTEELLQKDRWCSGLTNKQTYLNASKNRITVATNKVLVEQALSTALVGLYKSLGGAW